MDESRRRLRDARELRVLAHPVRMRLRQALYERGTATATELAEMIGESPANCSWHLRQLAKYGFAEEAGGGTGRNRPWRPTSHTLSWGDSDEAGEVAAASDQLSAMVYD
jgi:predicted ArsR family transcriptional regulator